MTVTSVHCDLDNMIEFDGKGGMKISQFDNAAGPIPVTSWLSLSLDAARNDLHKLAPNLSPFAYNIITHDEGHTGLWQDEQGIVGVVRCAKWDESEQEVSDFISIRFFVCHDYLITVQKQNSEVIDLLAQDLKHGQGPKTPVDCLLTILVKIQQQLNDIMTDTEDAIDEFEEHLIFPSRHTKRREISELRYRLINLRRYVVPQRDALSNLLTTNLPACFSAKHKLPLKQLLQSYQRLIDKIELGRERTKILQDELTAFMQDKMNQKMYLLSIVAVIVMPIGLITGLLGINVGGIPGAQSGTAFWWVCGGLLGFIGLLLAIFKWRRWL